MVAPSSRWSKNWKPAPPANEADRLGSARRPGLAADLWPARLHPAAAGLGEAHRVKAAGNDEPIPFNRVSDAGRIGLDRAQVIEGLPSLRLTAGRLIEFAHDAKRRLLERANFWRASSALRCCALWHIAVRGSAEWAPQVDVSLPH